MFSKDPNVKTRQEQMAVAGLSVVFVVVFLQGPARNLGWFRSRPAQSAPLGPTGEISRSATDALRDYRQRMDAAIETGPAPVVERAQTAPRYTAHDLRNPFKSVIPEPPPKPIVEADLVTPVAKPPPPPPPALDIQGLLWGGELPQAIIGHQIYRVGDSIGGMTIIDIDYRGITVDYHGEPVVYPVSDSPLKLPSAIGAAATQQAQWR
ncbi:MAG: hypothetical protein COV75_06785 [Candidatus Omnitrophica bacterium CG11_big_fil_rev_8_21_14_0_20_63_9]|nr:MAG: hypothetical protein COV75_06785 [Candidatus Omnitrophica bacterium CG11_big_fil_rev_8_21_14_0_20_63_9]